MVWNLDTPKTSPWGALDTYKITSVLLDIEGMCYLVKFKLGKMEGDPEEFVGYEGEFELRIQDIPEGDDPLTGEVIPATTEFAQMIAANMDVYNLIKELSYDKMVDKDLIEPGTME